MELSEEGRERLLDAARGSTAAGRSALTRFVAMSEAIAADARIAVITDALRAQAGRYVDWDHAPDVARIVAAALDAHRDAQCDTGDVIMGTCDMCERKVPRVTLTSRAGFLAFCPNCDSGRPGGISLQPVTTGVRP